MQPLRSPTLAAILAVSRQQHEFLLLPCSSQCIANTKFGCSLVLKNCCFDLSLGFKLSCVANSITDSLGSCAQVRALLVLPAVSFACPSARFSVLHLGPCTHCTPAVAVRTNGEGWMLGLRRLLRQRQVPVGQPV